MDQAVIAVIPIPGAFTADAPGLPDLLSTMALDAAGSDVRVIMLVQERDHSLATTLLSSWQPDVSVGWLPIEIVVQDDGSSWFEMTRHGLQTAVDRQANALLIDPSIRMASGVLRELSDGLSFDAMAGFCSPRVHGDPITAFPFETLPADLTIPDDQEALARQYQHIARSLQRFSFGLLASPSCVLIRWDILAELGGLGVPYPHPSACLNHLVMAANRLGYSVISANHGVVVSDHCDFRESLDHVVDEVSRQFPELAKHHLHRLDSASRQEEILLTRHSVRTDAGASCQILVDATSIARLHNGTSVVFRKMLQGLMRYSTAVDCRISVMVDADNTVEFFGLDTMEGLSIVRPDVAFGYDLVVKPGQPFHLSELWDHAERALSVVYHMLDTIAWDCKHLSDNQLDACWRAVADLSDGLLFISPFSEEQFKRRFKLSQHVMTQVCGLSMASKDYQQAGRANGTEPASDGYHGGISTLLVFGNDHDHKFVAPTVNRLADAFKEWRIQCLGSVDPAIGSHLEAFQPGRLSEEELDNLIQNADVVVYPSHYEGFGLPILEIATRGIPIFIRESELNRWILDHYDGPDVIRTYRTTDELIGMLEEVSSDKYPSHSRGLRSEASITPVADSHRVMTGTARIDHSWDGVAERTWELVSRLIHDKDPVQMRRRFDELERIRIHFQRSKSVSTRQKPMSSSFARRLYGRIRHTLQQVQSSFLNH